MRAAVGAYHGPDGKRRTVSAKTKTECNQKLRAAQGDADKGMVFDAGNLTVAGYLKNWIKDQEGINSQATYDGYERMVRNHLIPTLGRNLLKNLTPAHVRAMYRQKRKRTSDQKGLSPRTVQYIHVTLHKALKDAVYDGLIPRNVTEGVKPPKLEQKEAEFLTKEQARKLLDTSKDGRLEALYILALHTGVREGELLRLEWSDWRGEYLHVRGTKNKTSVRAVKLSQTTQDALRGHRSRQREERLAAPPTWEDSGLIFPTQNGRKMDRHNLWRQFKRLLKHAEVPDVPFHSLRHTCATLLFHAGKDLMYVQNQFGHSSSKITRDTYTHHIQGSDGGLADAMDELLG